MNNKILLPIFLTFSVLIFGQKSIDFEVKINPNTIYHTINKSSSTTAVTFIGDKEMLDQLQKDGYSNPTSVFTSSEVEFDISTDKKLENGNLPSVIKYHKMTSTSRYNGNETSVESPLTGMKAYITYDPDLNFSVDSLTGNQLTDQLKEQYIQTLTNIQKDIQLPKKTMHIGDSFTKKVPLQLPTSTGKMFTMSVETEYLLTKFDEKIAYFDLLMTIELDMENAISDNTLTATGNGIGKLQYDRKGQFIKSLKTQNSLDMKSKVQEDLDMTAKSIFETSLDTDILNFDSTDSQ